MAQIKSQGTKYAILQCATKLFLEKGYTNAYVTTIANTLQISTGNLTFWFPTKEHILAEMMKELCAFQAQADAKKADKKYSLLIEYLFELAMFASVCEENPNIKDLLIASYTQPLPLAVIRANDTERSKRTFAEFCKEWSETEYIQAENVASGIECAMFMTENAQKLTLEQRVTSSLDAIMKVYEVPKDIRQSVLKEVMAMDYRSSGNHVFEEFYSFVEEKMKENYGKR
ncbi:MAG: TetR/AcrR family transcriptional regulator [Lachnospiraceae bacterium]|nr:TetR/AcrR family transcriptional regulator [Lachnospiraceae bacterium]